MGNKAKNKQGLLAITLVILGNIASVLRSLQEISSFIARTTERLPLSVLYTTGLIIIVIGYALGIYYAYRKMRTKSPSAKKTLGAVIALVLIGAISLLNVVTLHRQYRSLVDEKLLQTWTDRIFSSQEESGGIRISPNEPDSDTQVWTTAQALKAALASGQDISGRKENIKRAFQFIEDSFQKAPNDGWGYWPNSDWTITEVAAWVLLAQIESLNARELWTDEENEIIMQRIRRGLDSLVQRQYETGGWSPIKRVSNMQAARLTRTYSTVMAVWALIEARNAERLHDRVGSRYDQHIEKGIIWLKNQYDHRLGWVPNPHRKGQHEIFHGLTAQALYVLSLGKERSPTLSSSTVYANAVKDFLLRSEIMDLRIEANVRIAESDQHLRPVNVQIEGSSFLWYPWSMLQFAVASADTSLTEESRGLARKQANNLASRSAHLRDYLEKAETYALAENVYCIGKALRLLK